MVYSTFKRVEANGWTTQQKRPIYPELRTQSLFLLPNSQTTHITDKDEKSNGKVKIRGPAPRVRKRENFLTDFQNSPSKKDTRTVLVRIWAV